MIDYKTFKKGYLHEWVDRSQAARKAAEELAKREVKPSLQDKYAYKDINQNLVFTLDGHEVEFKDKNEKKPDGYAARYAYFTYDEAMELFGEPDMKKGGWRLPTLQELRELKKFPYDYAKGCGVFDKRLALPKGRYWSSTINIFDKPQYCYVSPRTFIADYCDRDYKMLVRLVRDV